MRGGLVWGLFAGLLCACGGGQADPDGGAPGDDAAAADAGDGDASPADAGTADASLAACAVAEVRCGDTYVAGDTAGGPDDFSDYACLPMPSAVPEQIYQFTAPTDSPTTQVLVTTSNRSSNVRIMAMEGACEASECLGNQFSTLGFEALAGVTYYIALESWMAPSVSYQVSVLCDPPDTEVGVCGDLLDNDGDFMEDCRDEDCRDATAECGFGACTPSGTTIDCATTLLAGDTAAAEATDVADSYGCLALPQTPGPEIAYTFTAQATEPVLFTVSNYTGTPGIAVIDAAAGCHTYDCVTFQWFSAVAEVEAGKTYHVLVDSLGAAPIAYDLSVVCDPPAIESDCSDGIDDDGDFDIDCDDSDCAC